MSVTNFAGHTELSAFWCNPFLFQETIHAAKMSKILSSKFYEDTHESKILHKLNIRNVYVNEKSELHCLSPSVKDSVSKCTLARVDGQEKQMGFDNFVLGNAMGCSWG